MPKIEQGVSKQVATISRGPVPSLWTDFAASTGMLSTVQLRALGAWGIPAMAKATLIHMVSNLEWSIKNRATKGSDVNTEYYTKLLQQANDGIGGAASFIQRLAEDILCALMGGLFEIVRAPSGVPVALYNTDSNTMVPTYDYKRPFYQRDVMSPGQGRYFDFEEIGHILWHPFTDFKRAWLNQTPIQKAYTAISLIAASDEYNYRLLNEVIPQGILNLGESFDRARAMEWKAQWDTAISSGRLQDIGLLWGTKGVEFARFYQPLTDKAFSDADFWQASMVAASFEMSVYDLGLGLDKTGTKASATEQSAISRKQGFRTLLRLLQWAVEYYILPTKYQLVWEDSDMRDRSETAVINESNARTVALLVKALGLEEGITEAQRQQLISAEVKAVEAGAEQTATQPKGAGTIGNRAVLVPDKNTQLATEFMRLANYAPDKRVPETGRSLLLLAGVDTEAWDRVENNRSAILQFAQELT